MAERNYPRKYWWVVLIILPIVLALITTVPKLFKGSDPAGSITATATGNNNTVNVVNAKNMTVINNISVIAKEYEKYTGQALSDDLKQQIQQAVDAALANDHDKSIRLLEQVAARAPVPAIYNNLGVEYAKTENTDASRNALKQALAKDPQYATAKDNLKRLTATPAPRPKFAAASDALKFEASSIPAMVVMALNPGFAAGTGIHVVDSKATEAATGGGTYSIKYQPDPGATVAMSPGTYDVLVRNGSALFPLMRNVAVKEGALTRINPNALVGAVAIEPLTREGFPEITELLIVDRTAGDRRLIRQHTSKLGVTLPIPQGTYDVICKTADSGQFEMIQGLEVRAGAIARIDTNNEVAAIVVPVPTTPGLNVKAIYALRAGTDQIAAQTDAFGKPMLVHPGEVYDVALQQAAGLTRIRTKVTAGRGAITEIR
jgi:hypothetical protein